MITNTVAIWAEMEAKPGKEAEVEAFLKSARALVENEPETTAWFAVKLSDSKFGIFDTFSGESGRQAHLSGEVAKGLMAKAEELFAGPPAIQQIQILAEKFSAGS